MSDLRGCRILIVEDEILLCLMLEEMLCGLGCVCAGQARSLAAGLALVEVEPHNLDAAVLDLNLAGESRLTVAAALQGRSIPFVIATGYADPAVFSGLQGVPVLDKPYTCQQLEHALTALGMNCPAIEAA
jgi:CheY-like chemotaxis protein